MFTSTLTRLQLHLINSTSDKDLVSPPKFDLPRLTHLNLKTTQNISLRSLRKCIDLKCIQYIQLGKKECQESCSTCALGQKLSR
ncbi:hypothetical protein CROQUDRAFT_178991 [Cronartium quercuum f. sp. fusiforme G11]|uniref:Uncharacterized protein n=1 Tax=Cronartium quercuum f. sp. fusiforme G11 TaxID=708437 RepID=A0A9P6NRC7_9BASI|nr:hypothetical protein CROQUDRAFT_178991 [Cronartium quercuum f. sp. fusiforme G11]